MRKSEKKRKTTDAGAAAETVSEKAEETDREEGPEAEEMQEAECPETAEDDTARRGKSRILALKSIYLCGIIEVTR